MAIKKSVDTNKMKIVMLSVFLIGFIIWRMGFASNPLDKLGKSAPVQPVAQLAPIQSASPLPQLAPPIRPDIETHDLYADSLYLAKESEIMRIAGYVINNKTHKAVFTVVDNKHHIRFVPDTACRFDRFNQPTCLVENQIVTLFTGSSPDYQSSTTHKDHPNDVRANNATVTKSQPKLQKKRYPFFDDNDSGSDALVSSDQSSIPIEAHYDFAK